MNLNCGNFKQKLQHKASTQAIKMFNGSKMSLFDTNRMSMLWNIDSNSRYMQFLSTHRLKLLAILSIILVLLFYHINYNQPKIRDGNRNLVNPYGIEGEQRLPQVIIIGMLIEMVPL